MDVALAFALARTLFVAHAYDVAVARVLYVDHAALGVAILSPLLRSSSPRNYA